MKFANIFHILKKQIVNNKGFFFLIFIGLLTETSVSLAMPQVVSRVIDGLQTESYQWLMGVTMLYCFVVLFRGAISVFNTFISESTGWRLCDYLREDMFGHVFEYSIHRHREAKRGYFLERMEGDINILIGFLSNMFIDIISSTMMVAGILLVFLVKSPGLGFFFFLLSVLIFLLFAKTQNVIAMLWKHARQAETEALGEFSQDIAARQDVLGMSREIYVVKRFLRTFREFERKQVRASFLGNIPATIFFSMLNVGEGAALIAGILLMSQGRMTIGNVYLILSYVGLLNMPFYSLKYEFAQMPKILASIGRINDLYEEHEEPEQNSGGLHWEKDGSVMFEQVSFGYTPENKVLKGISFKIESGERVVIKGRTGSGKSTILQMIAGFYRPDQGSVTVGGHRVQEYDRENYYRGLYYMMQFQPFPEDTIRNHVTGNHDGYNDEEIYQALEAAGLRTWVQEEIRDGLDGMVNADDVSRDQIQLLAWAGILLMKPKVLLIDEFDSGIQDRTVCVIDDILNSRLSDTTVIMVTHRHRSSMNAHRVIHMEAGTITGTDLI